MDNITQLMTADAARENIKKYYIENDRANELYTKVVMDINDIIKEASCRGEQRAILATPEIGLLLSAAHIEKGILLVNNLKKNGFSIDIIGRQGSALLISW